MTGVVIDDRVLTKLEDVAKVLPINLAKRMLLVSEFITGVVRQHAPKGRTGAVMRSFHPAVIVSEDNQIQGGSISTYGVARIRDEGTGYLPGGVIQSKRPGGNLAIPISDEAKRTVGLYPRDWAKGRLFSLISKKGNLLLVEALNKKSIKVHYKLQPTVKQEGTHYLAASLPESTKIATEELGSEIRVTLKDGK